MLKRLRQFIQNRLPPNSFVRNVGVLAGGTAVAQAINVLALPIITRLYSPEDFSVLAVYTSLLGMIAVIACLRLEIAIPIPNDDSTAANLFVLALIFTTIVTAITAIVLFFFSVEITTLLNQPKLYPYLWLLPIGIWCSGIYASIQYWATRIRKFPDVAKTRMIQIFSSVSIQIGLGYFTTVDPLGLLLGQVMTTGAGIPRLGKIAWQDIQRLKPNISHQTLFRTFRKYKRFPKYSTIEAFANIANESFPILIIASAGLGPDAGFTSLAMRAASIPIGLIGSSMAQVYLSHAADEYRAGTLPDFTIRIIAGLVGIGFLPLLIIGVVAPMLVPFVFGEQWARVGTIIAWMMPWFIFHFISSPISMSLHVTENQTIAMLYQIWGIILRVGMTVWGTLFWKEKLIEVYAMSSAIFYFGYFVLIIHFCKVDIRRLFKFHTPK